MTISVTSSVSSRTMAGASSTQSGRQPGDDMSCSSGRYSCRLRDGTFAIVPRETRAAGRPAIPQNRHLSILRHAGPGEVAARYDRHNPRSGVATFHVHKALAIDDPNLGAAHSLRGLLIGEVLPRWRRTRRRPCRPIRHGGERLGRNGPLRCRWRSPKLRRVHLLPAPVPEAGRVREAIPCCARSSSFIDVGMYGEFVQGLVRTIRVSTRTALPTWQP